MALISDIGVPYGKIGMVYQPKLKNRYVAIFYQPTSGASALINKATNDAINAAKQAATNLGLPESVVASSAQKIIEATSLASPDMLPVLTSQCTKISKVNIDFEPIVLHRYNSNIKVSQSKYTLSDVTLTLEDDITNEVAKTIQALLNNQHSLIGSNSNPYMSTKPTADMYKFPMDIVSLDGGTNKLEIWNLSGCWFKTVNYGDLSWEDGTQAVIDVTLSVDHAQQTFTPLNLSGHALGGQNDTTNDYSLTNTVLTAPL